MALTTCKECGNEISTRAKKCPNCGAPRRKTSTFTWFVLIVVIFISGSWIFGKQEINKATQRAQTQKTDQKWHYYQKVDEMTSKPVYYAEIKSRNRVNFDFPYQGLQRATLTLRTHPRWGKEVILGVE
ncbi:MAG: zinc-ribbon domain-containing protein, partial [Rickettsiales bacterium]|nr:zinc-ribbon domain-containing protein [Rickettsiales bacterium]